MDHYHTTSGAKTRNQPPIENQLPSQHAAFSGAPVSYNSQLQQYVPQTTAIMQPKPGDLGFRTTGPDDIAPRPLLSEIQVMSRWNEVFPESMRRFAAQFEEPKGRSPTSYSIRAQTDWEKVCDVLELAKGKYQSDAGPSGFIRKVRRKVAENTIPIAATTVENAAKLAPDGIFSTPILGAVKIMMDAIKKSVTIRNKVLESLSGLADIFADAELFLATFPADRNIRESSVELAVAILDAIEKAIGFFTRNEYLRGGKAIFLADDYEKTLCECLEKIQTQSAAILVEAEKTHMYDSKIYSQETRLALRKIAEDQQAMHHDMAQAFNSMNNLFLDYIRQQDRKLDAAKQQIIYLTIENGVLRSGSLSPCPPSPQASPGTIPPASHCIKPSTFHDILCRTIISSILPCEETCHSCHTSSTPSDPIDVDIDLTDLTYILTNQSELLPRQRAQAEQIINTSLFRSFISSQSSTKLLVQWDSRPPRSFGGISPLSVFCSSMVRLLRGTELLNEGNRFLAAAWFCGQRQEHQHHNHSGVAISMLASIALQLLRQGCLDRSWPSGSQSEDEVPPFADLNGLAQLASIPPAPPHLSPVHRNAGLARAIGHLLNLLAYLINQLPETTTVFIIIDGVSLYERDDEGLETALSALSGLLRLASAAESHRATVKVLFTSTPGTDIIRAGFEEEGLILEVGTLSGSVLGEPSEDRMTREWGLGDGD